MNNMDGRSPREYGSLRSAREAAARKVDTLTKKEHDHREKANTLRDLLSKRRASPPRIFYLFPPPALLGAPLC